MPNGKKARKLRNENGGFKKEPKVGTPWYLRKSLTLRKGSGNSLSEIAGTPVSEKKMESLAKLYG